MKSDPVSYVVEEDSDDYGALSSDDEHVLDSDDPLLQGQSDTIGRHGDVIGSHGDVMGSGEEIGDDDFEKEMNEEIKQSMHSYLQKPSTKEVDKEKKEKPKFYDDVYFNSSDEDERAPDKRVQTNEELLYDPDDDDKNEAWVQRKRKSYLQPGAKKKKNSECGSSSATLACPACMTVLCRDCQQHETHHSQFRAMFVFNCLVLTNETLSYKVKEDKRRRRRGGKRNEESEKDCEELYNPVKCAVCQTKVGVFDKEEVYHFFNVLAT